MLALAETLDRFTPNVVGSTVPAIIAALSIACLLLTVMTLGRNYWRRNPPIDEDLQKHAAVLEKIKHDLDDLALKEKTFLALEKELKQRLDVHEAAIVTILQRVMDIIDSPALPPVPPKPRIGFRP